MAPSPRIDFLLLRNLIPRLVHEEEQEGSEQEEDAIHDPEREARLQHRACLVDAPHKRAVAIEPIRPDCNVEAPVEAEIRAVSVRDAPQLVDRGDEGAHEADVDKGYENCGLVARLASDEREERPRQREYADDEEGEDVGGCEEVAFIPPVDEPGQHAHRRDERQDLAYPPEIEEDSSNEHGDLVLLNVLECAPTCLVCG